MNVDIVFDCRWFGNHGIGRFALEVANRIEHIALPMHKKPMSPLDPFLLSLHCFKQGQWFFSPGFNAPFFCRVPYLLSVHDLNHVDRADNSNFFKRLYYRLILKRLCRRARAVLTVSDFSKNRIVQWFGVDASKVFNVGNGVSEIFSPIGERHEEAGGYLLCVSNRRGHKNERGLLRAFARAKIPVSVKLVLTGESDSTLTELAHELGISKRLLFTGKVAENDLAALYRGAVFLVFPSFYEGFGLPIVEAFASGIPVITSNVTSMPEIAGDAALLVNPHDVDELAVAMTRLYASPELRAQLVQRGFHRAAQYSWDAVVDRIKSAVNAVDTDPSYPLRWN